MTTWLLVSTLTFFGKAFLLGRVTSLSTGAVAAPTAATLILILYFSGLTGWLEEMFWLMRILGFIGVIAAAALLLKRGHYKSSTSTLYILLMTAFLFALVNTPSYSAFLIVDDYHHWGEISRTILERNRFVLPADNVPMAAYPPALALFHYYFLYGSTWSVQGSLYAQGFLSILMISTVLYAYRSATDRLTLGFFVLVSIAAYSLIWIFRSGFHSLWADLPLGLMFGVSVLLYIKNQHSDSITQRYLFLPVLLVLPIVKQVGLLFFLFAAAAILVAAPINRGSFGRRDLLVVFLAIFGGCIVYFGWRYYLQQTELVGQEFKVSASLREILGVLTFQSSAERHMLTLKNMKEYLFFSVHTTTYWFLISTVSGYVACAINGLTGRKILISLAIYVSLFTSYLAVLLLLYSFSFSEWEGVRLASIDRYLNTYLVGSILLSFGFIVAAFKMNPNRIRIVPKVEGLRSNIKAIYSNPRFCLILLSILIALPNTWRSLSDAYSSLSAQPPLGNPFYRLNTLATKLEPLLQPTSRIYVLWSGGTTDLPTAFRSMVKSRFTNNSCVWIVQTGQHPGADYPWACEKSPDELIDVLSNYDFLIIGDIEISLFNSHLSQLGVLGPDSIYKIERSIGGLRLSPVP